MHLSISRPLVAVLLLPFFALVAGCGDSGVGSDEEAARAYAGLDPTVDQAIALGFDGFNAASSANIDPQTGKGLKTGTIVVGGKVDQGSSDNKTMNLTVSLTGYSGDGKITYDTAAPLPTLDLKLAKIPTGTVSGSLAGDFTMSGELAGKVTLALTIAGDLQQSASGGVERKPGTTHITGSATSDFGVFTVDVTR